MLAERALEAVIANITPHAFATASWRLFLVGFRLFHSKTFCELLISGKKLNS
jgi:hypothetical protein